MNATAKFTQAARICPVISNAMPHENAVVAHNVITTRARSGSVRRMTLVGREIPVAIVTMPGVFSTSALDE